jgi:hypothetical protein
MQKIEQLIQADHYSVDVVRSIGETISSRWTQLMFHVEERMKLVMASTNWFKTAEQVGLVCYWGEERLVTGVIRSVSDNSLFISFG